MACMILWRFANQVFLPDGEGNLSPLVQSEPLTSLTASPPPSDLGAAFVKMILTFIAIIVLLFGTYWFIRRLIQTRLQRGTGNQAIQILEKKMLSPKTMLYLVEIENKRVLLAESHLEIKRLEGLSDPLPTEPK